MNNLNYSYLGMKCVFKNHNLQMSQVKQIGVLVEVVKYNQEWVKIVFI